MKTQPMKLSVTVDYELEGGLEVGPLTDWLTAHYYDQEGLPTGLSATGITIERHEPEE